MIRVNIMKREAYDIFAQLLHWSMAVIIIYTTIAGYAMHLVMDYEIIFNFLSTLNMSLATVAAPLLVIRYLWSFFRIDPNMPRSISNFQVSIAKLVHSLMYLLMFIVFTTGYLMLDHSYSFFWQIEIENLIKNKEVTHFFFLIHRIACISLMVSVVLHILAALKHQYIARNNLIRLML